MKNIKSSFLDTITNFPECFRLENELYRCWILKFEPFPDCWSSWFSALHVNASFVPNRFCFVVMSQLNLSSGRMMMNRWFAVKIQIRGLEMENNYWKWLKTIFLKALGEPACSWYYLKIVKLVGMIRKHWRKWFLAVQGTKFENHWQWFCS